MILLVDPICKTESWFLHRSNQYFLSHTFDSIPKLIAQTHQTKHMHQHVVRNIPHQCLAYHQCSSHCWDYNHLSSPCGARLRGHWSTQSLEDPDPTHQSAIPSYGPHSREIMHQAGTYCPFHQCHAHTQYQYADRQLFGCQSVHSLCQCQCHWE